MKKVAIQGHAASFHDIAARKYFSRPIETVFCDSFAEVFDAVNKESVDYGVVAIENSLYGSINEVYDLLLRNKFAIMGEQYLAVHQCLIGLPGTQLSDIREVHSHPVALAQCEDFLDKTLARAERFEHHDTAGSVADVKAWNDPSKAAIASKAAADLHGMDVLAKNIETNHHNYTRFVILSREPETTIEQTKTSLVLVTDHKAGALYDALGAFARRSINLTKLQSRPIVGEAWHYMFYVDIAAGLADELVQEALQELEFQNCAVTILGSYKANKDIPS